MRLSLLKTYCLVTFLGTTKLASAQQNYDDYQDYADGYAEQDNLYADYAASQDQPANANAGGIQPAGNKGGNFLKMVAIGGAGWILGGKINSARTVRQLKTRHMKDQKNLYSQYYNDVYKLQQQNAELAYVVEQYQDAIQNVATEMENDKLQREYEEFKQPDVDGDNRISRAEFNMYVKNYLSNYPGMTEKDYPKFEDFDHDGDGYIGFQEYAQQMALTVQQAEKEKASKLTY
mmetsp:Transcript_17155/g.32481  ORF Transcript_17155/g.32481 Transcript_17155/m.32481 type:complete len:233 (-) Transcript_17155:270-968(-)